MKNIFLILFICFQSILCDAQNGQWYELNTSGKEFDSGEITSIYCQKNGSILIGTESKTIIANETSYGKLYQWDSTTLTDLHFSPYYKKEIAVTRITGDAEGNIYVAGYFKEKVRTSRTFVLYNIPFIYKWDGKLWKQIFVGNLKSLYDVYVQDICLDTKGNLYAIGTAFMKDKHRYLAVWNGDIWDEVGDDKLTLRAEKNGPLVLCTDKEGNLYAGGNFAGHAKGNVFKWDGVTWTALGHEANALNADKDIKTITVDNKGEIYLACGFVNGSKKQYVAKWDGKFWTEVGYGVSYLYTNGEIYTLYVDDNGILYAAGRFINEAGNKYVAKWDGKQWTELGGDDSLQANNDILTLSMDNQGRLYAAGRFKNKNGRPYVAVFIP